MYKEHPDISKPNEEIIWKYLDLWKFEDLLNRKCLFFSRIDVFEDTFEGRSSDKLHSLFEIYKERTYANCWHQNDYESNLMWKVYIEDFFKSPKDSKGIVIQTSFTKLCKCLKDSKIDQYIGKVTYDNSVLKPEGSTPIPYFRKKKEFESEKEIRAIVQIINPEESNPEKGIYVNVNLTELIESIYISPHSSHDFITEVKKVASKYNLNKSIQKSNLYCKPIDDTKKQCSEIVIEPNTQITANASGDISFHGCANHFTITGQKPYDE